jgi:ketosteroid isomerase-like protein
MSACELAQRFFRLLADKDYERLDPFLHEDVTFAPMMFPGRLYRGHDEVLTSFYQHVFALPEYRPEASSFTDLSPDVALVEGRVRFVDERGSIHDKSAYWAMTFKDGKLFSLEGKGSRLEARRLADARAAERAAE